MIEEVYGKREGREEGGRERKRIVPFSEFLNTPQMEGVRQGAVQEFPIKNGPS